MQHFPLCVLTFTLLIAHILVTQQEIFLICWHCFPLGVAN
ncbi:hypothetical protein HMPREF3197_03491 [Klebsiella pneumoniae]|nr:hypothetical protein HMPREF3197_03491 [Klebsiella pneumoniae]